MKNGKILIIGGYGKMGRVIAKELSKSFRNQVIVAGRSFQKAKEFAEKLNNSVIPMEFDLNSFPESKPEFDDMKLVVMCIDQDDTKFVEWCFEQGIDYIDVTASYEFLSKVEEIENRAKESGTTAVLSVGLAPGITNLLAKICKLRVPEIQFLDLFILLGMGEKHGDEAIRWMIDNLTSDYSVMEKGELKQVSSFIGNKQTTFPDEKQKRKVYRFNFSDQHVITKTLQVNSVSTWICLDSSAVNWMLHLFRKTGLSKLLNIKVFKELLLKLFKTFSYGSEHFSIKVSAGVDYEKGYVYESSMVGTREAHTTGLVAAKVAEYLLTSSFPPGVFHIEELIEPLDFIKGLNGNTFKEHRIKTGE